MARGGDSFWHSLGLKVGAVTPSQPRQSTLSAAGRSHRLGRPDRKSEGREERADPLSGAIAGAVTSVVLGVMRRWATGRRRPRPHALARGIAAGAGAAGAALIYRLLLARRNEGLGEPTTQGLRGSPGEVADELLAGAGRGLLYAALLAPYLPGPPIVRGAIAGTVDYLAMPLGGLYAPLQALSPLRRVPIISILLETGDAEDEPYFNFLLHGVLLGLLYGDRPD